MRRIALICTAAAIAAAGALSSSAVKAMPVAPPAALGAERPQEGRAEKVAYVCRPAWRCGYYGCGWRQACGWAPGYSAYGFARPLRPYWAWRWRHRYW